MTANLPYIVYSKAGSNADIDVDFREPSQATLTNRPLPNSPRTRFRRYLTPWATDLPPTISYEHRRRIERPTLDLNQETFGEYPSIDYSTLQNHLLHPSQVKENSNPERELWHQIEDPKFEQNKAGGNGDDIGRPTGAIELQRNVGGPKRADADFTVPPGPTTSHGERIRSKLKPSNSVKLDSKLRFTTLISSAITPNELPETEKERPESVHHETKLQKRERKEQEARAAKAEKLRLKNLRDCAVCMDSFDKSQLIHPCHHYYCSGCLAGMLCAFLHLSHQTITNLRIPSLFYRFLTSSLIPAIKKPSKAPSPSRPNPSSDAADAPYPSLWAPLTSPPPLSNHTASSNSNSPPRTPYTAPTPTVHPSSRPLPSTATAVFALPALTKHANSAAYPRISVAYANKTLSRKKCSN